jgi:hypothetical protein
MSVVSKRSNVTSSDEHFTGGWDADRSVASLKSFQRKDQKNSDPPDDPGNPAVNFHGEKRSNQTHESTTDADAKLARKGTGKEGKLSFRTITRCPAFCGKVDGI